MQLVTSKEVNMLFCWLRTLARPLGTTKGLGSDVGNVISLSRSQVKDSISLGNDAEASKALVKLMKDSEEEYQNGISENYQVTNYAHT